MCNDKTLLSLYILEIIGYCLRTRLQCAIQHSITATVSITSSLNSMYVLAAAEKAKYYEVFWEIATCVYRLWMYPYSRRKSL